MRISPEKEGAGNAGCTLHPRSRAQRRYWLRARAYRAAEAIRHSLRNGFTAYNALSPVSHVLLPPSTPTSGRQDHTSLPYALAARVSRSLKRPPQPAPRRDDGRRPLWAGRDGYDVAHLILLIKR